MNSAFRHAPYRGMNIPNQCTVCHCPEFTIRKGRNTDTIVGYVTTRSEHLKPRQHPREHRQPKGWSVALGGKDCSITIHRCTSCTLEKDHAFIIVQSKRTKWQQLSSASYDNGVLRCLECYAWAGSCSRDQTGAHKTPPPPNQRCHGLLD